LLVETCIAQLCVMKRSIYGASSDDLGLQFAYPIGGIEKEGDDDGDTGYERGIVKKTSRIPVGHVFFQTFIMTLRALHPLLR
jgi:hypothetical protein